LSNIVLTGTGTGCVSGDGGMGTGDLSAFQARGQVSRRVGVVQCNYGDRWSVCFWGIEKHLALLQSKCFNVDL